MMRAGNIAAAAITMIVAAVLATPCAWATVPAALSSTALVAQDSSPPTGAVGGVRSPMEAASTLNLMIDASDTAAGLASAQASIGGNTASVSLCPFPASAGGAVKASPGGECPESVSNVPLPIDVGGEGSHVLLVTVTDAAGNTTTLVDQTIAVESPPPPGSNTVTIGIGSGGGPPEGGRPEGGPPGGGKGGRGGVLGAFYSTVCRSPLLAMGLVSRPLRYAKVGKRRVPVLLARRHYVYRGRLTCLLNNHRVSAPTGTVVHVLDEVGRRILKSGRGTMTVHKGALRAILGYTSARTISTIIFRYGPIDGELVQVKLPIEIGSKRAKTTTHRRAKTKKKGRAAR
jgi:hypothetical protein